jgi:hypothetical protein
MTPAISKEFFGLKNFAGHLAETGPKAKGK